MFQNAVELTLVQNAVEFWPQLWINQKSNVPERFIVAKDLILIINKKEVKNRVYQFNNIINELKKKKIIIKKLMGRNRLVVQLKRQTPSRKPLDEFMQINKGLFLENM